MRQQPLIHAFVTPAQQGNSRHRCQRFHPALRQPRSLRTEINHVHRLRCGVAYRAQRSAQRFNHHHHARAATIRCGIYRAMAIVRVIPRIPGVHLQQLALLCTPHHPDCSTLTHELGKQGNDINAHAFGPVDVVLHTLSEVRLPVHHHAPRRQIHQLHH